MTLFDRFFASEPLRLDEQQRSAQPGRFLQLSDGVTHYEVAGPNHGKTVVLVHGFSVPYFIWDPTFEALAEAGFRSLRYDLYGRGYSDRPRLANTKDLFVRQLKELLEALDVGAPGAIVSLSMGGVVAAEFARRYPQRVQALTFVGPAGFELGLPWTVRLLHVPLMGEILLGVLGLLGHRRLLLSILGDFYKPPQEALDAFVPRYQAQMQYQGFKRSLLSTLREGLLEEDVEAFRALGESGKPVQLIWGREDNTVPFRHHAFFRRLVPQCDFHAIEDAGHIPHFERPELVNPLLIDFLSKSL